MRMNLKTKFAFGIVGLLVLASLVGLVVVAFVAPMALLLFAFIGGLMLTGWAIAQVVVYFQEKNGWF